MPKVDTYIEQLTTATDPQKRWAAARALVELGDKSAIVPLENALIHDNPAVRIAAAHALRKLSDSRGAYSAPGTQQRAATQRLPDIPNTVRDSKKTTLAQKAILFVFLIFFIILLAAISPTLAVLLALLAFALGFIYFIVLAVKWSFTPQPQQIRKQPYTKSERHIPTHVKLYVWRRDGGRCVECGSNEKLEYDHIIPVSKGGSNTERNVQLLCEHCNRKKQDKIM